MRKEKKLFLVILPILFALVIVAILFTLPFSRNFLQEEVKEQSVAQSNLLFTSSKFRKKMMSGENILPILGSSELSRLDAFHPASLANKYQRPYLPFSVGSAGSTSLAHFFFLAGSRKELKNRKMIFFISPQWFTKQGMNQARAWQFLSKNEVYSWLAQIKEITEMDKVLAQRLLNFEFVHQNESLQEMIEKVSRGKQLSEMNKQWISLQSYIYKGEDKLFSSVKKLSSSSWEKIKEHEKELPEEYNYATLDKLAEQIAKSEMSNNSLHVENAFYEKNVKPKWKKLRNFQKKYSYLKSPEYADFQFVLNEIDRLNMDAMFVILPINNKWMKHSGLSQKMLNRFSVKIQQQLTSQGFHNIVDFTEKGKLPYFLTDPTHIGYRGWVDLDPKIQAFYQANNQNSYHIDNPKYLSKTWANQK